MRLFQTTPDLPALVLAFLTCGLVAACTQATRTSSSPVASDRSLELTPAEADAVAAELATSAAAFLCGYKEVGGRADAGPIRLHVGEQQFIGARGSVLLQVQDQLVRSGLVVTEWAKGAEGLQAELELRLEMERFEHADGRATNVVHSVDLILVDTASGSVAFASRAQLDKQFFRGWFGR